VPTRAAPPAVAATARGSDGDDLADLHDRWSLAVDARFPQQAQRRPLGHARVGCRRQVTGGVRSGSLPQAAPRGCWQASVGRRRSEAGCRLSPPRTAEESPGKGAAPTGKGRSDAYGRRTPHEPRRPWAVHKGTAQLPAATLSRLSVTPPTTPPTRTRHRRIQQGTSSARGQDSSSPARRGQSTALRRSARQDVTQRARRVHGPDRERERAAVGHPDAGALVTPHRRGPRRLLNYGWCAVAAEASGASGLPTAQGLVTSRGAWRRRAGSL
jgi:hypothetical protein